MLPRVEMEDSICYLCHLVPLAAQCERGVWYPDRFPWFVRLHVIVQEFRCSPDVYSSVRKNSCKSAVFAIFALLCACLT